ncbi:accessory gland protein Acp63F [Drosophila ficusphila]|uniref:accessory gland protein Acp63F n=1 Tax=Drosophila ficusphila TaxID=30025 RepID=UPI0007E7CAC4|nr:accessory gland protein Acp63F [Drosophila ficusphila]
MKIHLIIVLVILGITVAEEECPTCDWSNEVHCGEVSDGTCVFTALNRCQVERVSCRREQKGSPPFTKIYKGKCPSDKPKCNKP